MIFNRLSLTQKVVLLTALGLLSGIALSWPLWYAAARTLFPLLPIVGPAYREAAGLSLLGSSGLLLSLAAVLIFSAKKIPIIILLVCLLLLCGLDLNRLQPWVWLYGLVLAIVVFDQSSIETRDTLRWLVAAVYIWSGFHKLTPYFAEDNFAWFCSAFRFTAPFANFSVLGYGVALLEILLAFGLLWPRTRSAFRWLVLVFHGSVVLMLSPLGLNWNAVVIPWNLTLAALVWVIYAPSDATFLPKNNAHRFLLILAGIAPLLHFAEAWPEALSWKLYSNTQTEATFYAPAGSFNKTMEQEALWEANAYDHGTKMLLDDWANAELHTPMFGTERNFRQTALYLCGCTTQPDRAGLYLLTVQPWDRKAEQWQKIPCRELHNNLQKAK